MMKIESILKGVGFLVIAQIVAMGITFLLNSFLATNLGSEDYGKFSLVLSVVGVLSIIFNFGYFASIGVLVGEEKKEEKQKELLGGIICVLVLIGVLTVLSIQIFGRFLDGILDSDIGFIFYSLWFVIAFYPARELITQFAKGLGNSWLIGFSRVFVPMVFALITALLFFFNELNLLTISFAQFSSIILLFFIFLIWFKPKFKNLVNNLKLIHKKNLFYGRKIYVGSVAANTWPELIVFLIPIYGTLSDVAFYKISLMLISPLALIGQNLSLFLFRGFVGEGFIDKRFVFGYSFIAIFTGLIFVLISKYVVDLIFGREYHDVIFISQVMIVGAVINSIYQVPDSYMNANSNGSEVLKSSIVMGVTAVVFSGVLIPLYGLVGAALVYVLSNLSYAVAISYFYQKVTAKRFIR